MEVNEVLSKLSKHLFWDVDTSSLDWKKHSFLIVERVITRGTYSEFKYVENYFTKNEMGEIIKSIKKLNKKDISFVHTYFNIPLQDLKCYKHKL